VALNFERSAPDGTPFGWFIEGDAKTATTTVTRAEAGNTFAVRNTGQDPVFLYTPIPVDNCHRSVSIAFEARSESGSAAGVVLRPASGGPDIGETAALSNGWRSVEHTSRTETCLEAGVGIGALINGSVEIRSVSIKTDGRPAELERLTQPELDDLHTLQEAFVTPTLATSPGGFESLLQGNVIGLGETSHGAAALFELKLDLLKALASRGQLDAVAVELPAAAADIIDEYVAGHADDRKAVIEALSYPAWQTEEMLRVIDWLRGINLTRKAGIRFRGFDVQQPIWAARGLLRLGIPRDEIEKVLKAETPEAALAALDASEERWSGKPGGARYVRLWRRGIQADRPDLGGASRDELMGLEALVLARETEGTLVLWADNTHLTKIPRSMGSVLHDALGPDYVAIGLSFASGFYSAYGPETPYPAAEAYDGTHEKLLLDANVGRGFLALADLPESHPIFDARGWRYIGSRPQEFGQFLPHKLSEHFDAIGFVPTTTSTSYVFEFDF
jgi:erythromycin esterase-like protein